MPKLSAHPGSYPRTALLFAAGLTAIASLDHFRPVRESRAAIQAANIPLSADVPRPRDPLLRFDNQIQSAALSTWRTDVFMKQRVDLTELDLSQRLLPEVVANDLGVSLYLDIRNHNGVQASTFDIVIHEIEMQGGKVYKRSVVITDSCVSFTVEYQLPSSAETRTYRLDFSIQEPPVSRHRKPLTFARHSHHGTLPVSEPPPLEMAVTTKHRNGPYTVEEAD